MANEGYPAEDLFGQGRLAERAGAVDWTSTPLGAPDRWSAELRVAIGVCLKSTGPCALFAGEPFCMVFNQAYGEDVLDGRWELLGAEAGRFAAGSVEKATALLRGVVADGEPLADASGFAALIAPQLSSSLDSSLDPVPGSGGMIGVLHRVSVQTRREKRGTDDVAELQHKTYNLLAVVRAIFSETVTEASSLSEFKQHFSDRLAALSRVHGLLGRSASGKATIGQLLKLEFDALAEDDGRVELGGPEVEIKASSIQVLSLAIHELCTNALTHGALSHPEGRLRVLWHMNEDADRTSLLKIVWEEHFGRTIQPDQNIRSGFGRQLIEQALPYQLGTQTWFEVSSDRLVCTMSMPLPDETSSK